MLSQYLGYFQEKVKENRYASNAIPDSIKSLKSWNGSGCLENEDPVSKCSGIGMDLGFYMGYVIIDVIIIFYNYTTIFTTIFFLYAFIYKWLYISDLSHYSVT